jgi:3-oxoacyl-[acyl-carrier protein] reductase
VTEARVALVTGARKGIGRHLAAALAGCGYRVIGCGRKPVDWTLDGYEHFIADVSSEADVRRLFQHIRKTHGRLDAAINNAGIASMNHSMLTPGDTAARLLNVNVLGSFLVCREAAKLMQRRGYGRIINFSTVAVPLLLDGEAMYAASKSAVETLTRVLAREVGSFGITVNAVGPTPIATDLIRNVPEDKIQAITRRLAVQRLGTLDDVWNVVEFFLRPQSDAVTGQVVYLGGA